MPRRVPDAVPSSPRPPTGSLPEYSARELSALARGVPAAFATVITEGPTVSLGIGVPETAPFLARARAAGLPTVRRHGGGTGLVHLPGDCVWTVVLPRSDPRAGRDYVRAYARLGAPVVSALSERGVRSAWSEPPGRSEEYCTLGSRGDILQSGGTVLGGAAQHLTAHALLHHGTISWSVDRTLIERLFAFEPHGLADRLGGVADLGARGGPEALAEAVAERLNEFVRGTDAPGNA